MSRNRINSPMAFTKFDTMISVQEAKEKIRQHSQPLAAAILPLDAAAGKTLAAEVRSPLDIPAYPQSSMDGYAIFYDGSRDGRPVTGEIPAGRTTAFQLQPGKAVRIFTGAPVPPGADTVVMQEKCRVTDGLLYILDEQLKKGDNVRPAGSEIGRGAIGLEPGTTLSPAAIGFLAGIGITEVPVYPSPAISILITGNELQAPGSPLGYGQVYESNSFSLQAALRQVGITEIAVFHVGDDPSMLGDTLREALEKSDLVLLTGGVSVGDYDFTLEAAERNGVSAIFHKIKQRPGKPLFFGTRDEKLVFGLPGNPSSVLTCFYEYVLEAISIQQNKDLRLRPRFLALEKGYTKNHGFTHFLKGIEQGETVKALDGQESYKLNSFARANCLIVIPEDVTVSEAGSLVEIHPLPQ